WISAINSYFYDAAVRRVILQYLFPKGADGKPDRGTIDPALAQVGALLAWFERAYGERNFLVGNAVSIADLLLAPIIDYLGQVPEGPSLLAAHTGVVRAHQAIAVRPSFSATRPTS
ncbi:MAG: glutathione S-transferase family protein, partial [Burkholderiales bacterium]